MLIQTADQTLVTIDKQKDRYLVLAFHPKKGVDGVHLLGVYKNIGSARATAKNWSTKTPKAPCLVQYVGFEQNIYAHAIVYKVRSLYFVIMHFEHANNGSSYTENHGVYDSCFEARQYIMRYAFK